MKKILIIDDEFIVRQGLRYMMDWEACGYTIAGEASNGQEGLELCRTLKPDLILCDVVMPVLNGVEFVREIHSMSGPPVIMLSNFDEYDKVRKAFQYGASDYILKNQISKELLISCLEQTISTESETRNTLPQKNFGILIRQALDGYAVEPYTELSSYLNHRLCASSFMVLFLDSLQPDFKNEPHLEEYMLQQLSPLQVCAASTTQHHAVCLIGLTGDTPCVDTSSLLRRLKKRIRHTSCVLGRPFERLSDIRKIIENLYELTKYSILYEDKLIFYEADMQSETLPMDFSLSDRYFSYVRATRLKEALDCLLSCLDTVKNTNSVHPFHFRKFLDHTLYETFRILRKTAKHSPMISRIELKLFKRLDNSITYIQILEALSDAFRDLASVCTAMNQDDSIISALNEYLEKNYASQITLYDAAEHLHMNYSYLSAYVSQNTGKHFSWHLNHVRIRHARQMLADTDYSISFISESIGYTDQSYFGKILKKTVGMTPLQYRNYQNRK